MVAPRSGADYEGPTRAGRGRFCTSCGLRSNGNRSGRSGSERAVSAPKRAATVTRAVRSAPLILAAALVLAPVGAATTSEPTLRITDDGPLSLRGTRLSRGGERPRDRADERAALHQERRALPRRVRLTVSSAGEAGLLRDAADDRRARVAHRHRARTDPRGGSAPSRRPPGRAQRSARANSGRVLLVDSATTSSTGCARYMPFSRIPSAASSISGHVEIVGTRGCRDRVEEDARVGGFATDRGTRRTRPPRGATARCGRSGQRPALPSGRERVLDEPPRRVLLLRGLGMQ